MRGLLLLLLAGCISVGGGPAINTAITDSPVRRMGGGATFGTYGELVESSLVAQLFYGFAVVPLGSRADSQRVYGARLTSANGRGFGYYGMLAIGVNPDSRPESSSRIASAGVAFSQFKRAWGGWTWGAATLGVTYHRAQQETIDLGEPGHFLGLELTVQAGYDLLGPLRQRKRPSVVTEP